MEDATSAIYSAFLVEQEGTASSFRRLREVVVRHGQPERHAPTRSGITAAGRRIFDLQQLA